MDKKLVCPCGLTCGDCLFYKNEIYETAYKLKLLIEEHELDKFLNIFSQNWRTMGDLLDMSEDHLADAIGSRFEVFNQMPVFMNVLDNLVKLQCKTTCQEVSGCSIGGITHQCKALKCIKSKSYDGCWQCSDFENCDNLKFLKNGYGFVIEDNLKTIKEKGVEAIKSRGNKYYAWQRRTNCD